MLAEVAHHMGPATLERPRTPSSGLQLNIKGVPPDLMRAMRIAAATEGRSMSKVVVGLIDHYLQERHPDILRKTKR